MNKRFSRQSLADIPGIGNSIASDLRAIGIHRIDDLVGKDPELLYELSSNYVGSIQDRCLLVFSAVPYTMRKRRNTSGIQKNSNGGIGRMKRERA